MTTRTTTTPDAGEHPEPHAAAATPVTRSEGGFAHRGRRLPVLTLGFRPFYLAAAAFAAVAVPVWLAQYQGLFVLDGHLQGPAWHAHEMIFGFAAAVVTGFLFTAVRQWTGMPTPTGAVLAAFLGLWVAGRVLVLTGPAILAVVIDVSFLPAVAIAIAWPIVKSGNHRNHFAVALLGILATANLFFHLDQLGAVRAGLDRQAAIVAFDAFAILMAVVAGRVIPAFTRNAVPTARPRRFLPIEIGALGLLILIFAMDAMGLWRSADETWLAIVAAAAAGFHIVRLWLWDPLVTRHKPLLWMLPLSYAWIPVALTLRAAAAITDASFPALSEHALGIGAMGGLMLAMMTRSALGHTGRALTAGRAETSAFVLVQFAALSRIGAAIVTPELYGAMLTFSSACWSGAFLVFFVRYWPFLTRPRADGRPE